MRIGVLTGGGDCGGLNAAIRAVVIRAARAGHGVVGVHDGWKGMVEGRGAPLSVKEVAGIMGLGGTILGSSRTNPAKIEHGYEQVEANFATLGIEALVAIGGDDTLGVAAKLAARGGHVVGVPKTMDNDVNGTDSCIGFQTAVERVTNACDNLRTTADSHHRILVLEVMGRHAGWVAIEGGLAGGADVILVPEEHGNLIAIAERLTRRRDAGYQSSIVVVAEGAEIDGLDAGAEDTGQVDAFGHAQLVARALGERLADKLNALTKIESRAMVLGHLQRGGPPAAFDRILGARLGAAAVDLVLAGDFGKAPVLRGMRIVTVDLAETVAVNRTADLDLYHLAEALTAPV
ncbi:MAG TPA: ATP-dependent 6-phosphofructokinase [Ktedonobacterales bacterium]|jgi:6-phosphofructokinase 1|nr:ATP-dependent 6-phosphofructokinase [Ktedonobacterales bacterium]